MFSKTKTPSAAEVQRVNQQLEERHYEFVSNCQDGDGDASACHSWGEWLAVVDKKYDEAAKVYAKNCNTKGYAASCFNLGRLKLAGKGVETNDKEAIDLFEKSCQKGHSQGCHHLGFMLSKGMGRKQNESTALEAFKKACDLDDANSCNRVASIYLTANSNVSRDVQKAKQYLERACDANFAPACHNLAVMYKKGDDSIPKDEQLYEQYRKKTKDLIAQAGGMSGVKAV